MALRSAEDVFSTSINKTIRALACHRDQATRQYLDEGLLLLLSMLGETKFDDSRLPVMRRRLSRWQRRLAEANVSGPALIEIDRLNRRFRRRMAAAR